MTHHDARLERAVGRVLSVGVTTSSVCLALGLGLSMFAGTAGAAHRLLSAGLVILLMTPAGRVAISVGEYTLERDWVFVLLTTIVLLELAGSLFVVFR